MRHGQQAAGTNSRELQQAAVLGLVLLLAVTVLVGLLEGWPWAGRFLWQSSLVWALAWQQAWLRRGLNYAAEAGLPYPQLGWANRLTLLRGMLIAATAGFLFQPPATALLVWLPALCYGLAAVLDRIDGLVARRSGQTSRLGSELDTVFDALGLVVAPLLAAAYGKVHWTYLLVSAAYYLFVGGCWWRRRHGLPLYPLQPNNMRRTLAGFQMGFVALALWPWLPAALTRLAGVAFMLPLLAGFVLDWLAVSGRIQPADPPATEYLRRLGSFSATVLQPLLRLGLAILLVSVALFAEVADDERLCVYGLLACALLLAAGLAARITAILALILLACLLPAVEPVVLPAAVFCAVFILLLGAGRFSLWQRDDDSINRHDGE
jgi:CDP-diacylglycerol---glycerol-3-phosphate 3-phosphatidyltransferase